MLTTLYHTNLLDATGRMDCLLVQGGIHQTIHIQLEPVPGHLQSGIEVLYINIYIIIIINRTK